MTSPDQLTAMQALSAMSEACFPLRTLVEACLSRIAERDGAVRARLSMHPEARAKADRLDALPPDRRGLLHGLPIGVKDVFDTQDLPTTDNSPLYQGFRPAVDAAAVALLPAEGAIVLSR